MTEQEQKKQAMLIPSEKFISEIIAKLRELKGKKEEFSRQSWIPPKTKKTKAAVTIEELINVAYEFRVSLTKDEVIKLFPNFDQISTVATPDKIREQAKTVCIRLRAPCTPEEKRLNDFVDYVKEALKQHIETAQDDWWTQNAQPLIDDIELQLFPYWAYLMHYGTWRGLERSNMLTAIESKTLQNLPEVIKEFERFKHQVQLSEPSLAESRFENPQLTDTEDIIIEALGNKTLHGLDLLKKAGLIYNSHYRTILSNLVKRKVLDNCAQGYYRHRPDIVRD
jgi:hypothetical protein